MVKKIKAGYLLAGQKLGAALRAPTRSQAQVMLFLIGVGLLAGGMTSIASASPPSASTLDYNDERIVDALNVVFGYIEGSFGAMVMVTAGLGAIVSSALGQYKAALGLLIVGVGAFILRSLVATFFEVDDIR